MDKLHIQNEMLQLDRKNREFYDELTDEEKKKFSTFVLLRWGCTIQGDPEFQKYYIQSCNEQVNKHFWDLNKHPKLQWLLLTCISPNMGTFKHEWIGYSGKQSKNKRVKILANLYPDKKMSDLETLEKLMSKEEFLDMLKSLGWQDKDIKEALK